MRNARDFGKVRSSVATSTSVPAPVDWDGRDSEDRAGRLDPGRRRASAVAALAWLLTAVGVGLAGYEFVLRTAARPSYDAFGWLTWGRQVLLHWNLNTDGAPSWKPLTFLFTLPYAAFGNTQVTLWTATASAAAIASSVFAARIAVHLAGGSGERIWHRWPELLGGLFAGAGVLGLSGLPHQMLIATSDPMVVTLCLAAIDAHLSGRRRLALAFGVLAALGRPEVWAFAGLYAAWCWARVPPMRSLVVLGVLLVPAGWFVIPGITSHSWFISGDLALHFPGQIYGNKVIGVTKRFLGLYELPMQLAVVGALLLALARRDRTWIVLALASVLWVAIEIAFAYHGWPASQRYLMEPAAVCVVLAGAAFGRVIGFAAYGGSLPGLGGGSPSGVRGGPPSDFRGGPPSDFRGGPPSDFRGGPPPGWEPLVWLLRIGAVCLVSGLVVALAPIVRARTDLWRTEIAHAKTVARGIDNLAPAIQLAGGPAAVRACGRPISWVGYQSTLAWAVGMNVGDIGYKVRQSFASRKPIVYFRPDDGGWEIRAVHRRRRDRAACRRIDVLYDLPAPIGTAIQSTRIPPAMRREFVAIRRTVAAAFSLAGPVHHVARHARPRHRRHAVARHRAAHHRRGVAHHHRRAAAHHRRAAAHHGRATGAHRRHGAKLRRHAAGRHTARHHTSHKGKAPAHKGTAPAHKG